MVVTMSKCRIFGDYDMNINKEWRPTLDLHNDFISRIGIEGTYSVPSWYGADDYGFYATKTIDGKYWVVFSQSYDDNAKITVSVFEKNKTIANAKKWELSIADQFAIFHCDKNERFSEIFDEITDDIIKEMNMDSMVDILDIFDYAANSSFISWFDNEIELIASLI